MGPVSLFPEKKGKVSLDNDNTLNSTNSNISYGMGPEDINTSVTLSAGVQVTLSTGIQTTLSDWYTRGLRKVSKSSPWCIKHKLREKEEVGYR